MQRVVKKKNVIHMHFIVYFKKQVCLYVDWRQCMSE